MIKSPKYRFDDELKVFCLCVVCIFVLEGIALLKGVDGTMFGMTMAAFGTIGGFLLKCYLADQKHKE